MPNNELATISKPPVTSSEIARQTIVGFSELCQREITTELVQMWQVSLCDIPLETLKPACDRLLKTWSSSFLPLPGNVRDLIEEMEERNFEDEWLALLDYCREWIHPDIHFSRAPELPVEIDHAARAAGGVHFLRSCSSEELSWRKKTFVEDLTRSRKTGDLAGLLTSGELRKLLRQAARPVARLPDSIAHIPTVAAERDRVEPARETNSKMVTPIHCEYPRTVDVDGRIAELKRQAGIIQEKYKNGNVAEERA